MRILMVCLGNICRSPLAHGVMQHLVKQEELDWHVDSAGTGNWHVGEAPDERSVAVAKKYGIDISAQKAQHFLPSFFASYDYIFVMDNDNYNDVLALTVDENERTKVRMFLKEGTVPDPYYDGQQFEAVYQMVERRCRQLIKELQGVE